FKNFHDMLQRVDVAVVAVPTQLHYTIAMEVLNSGIHVLLEKPCSDNLEHARELFALADSKNLILHIGHVERFNGAVQELHKLVEDPILVECRRMGPFVERMKDDSVVLDTMIHDIDIILNLIDSKVLQINVMGRSVFSEKDDVVSVQLEFENGCMANILASRASQNKERTLSITQKASFVILDYTDQEIYVHRQSSSDYMLTKDALRYKQESLIERIFVHKDNPLKLEIQHFLDCVKNGTPRKVAVDNELYSLEIALSIVENFYKRSEIPH
ncbi:MAG: Gfo/Idh/MocA family oxidoreductase, partial [Nitrospinaceae bacterium]|nr:Gfo/Idh/MocA family oxidoreductase [Nitrospinaceae bacterium]NIR54228.1 Gfo/Idh/MocA family oxidoreductase [Nitrospinaceae bacterium]NIS84643.1 Gfo/Idh/MocA family oxidoreductase [Nitrospinaceae bacterium]NIT81438.1 Gfo/Idh/MocA family oxidoreductase [Nitrospinaceae bacterium]NIU43721.1 Gfo/Idh/MocA family oxidoreductase [Nitrospinaceae bacterium]